MFYLVRNGETPWSLTGKHTGLTDVHLTDNGKEQAKVLKPLLKHFSFSEVWCSPLIRAVETCQLTGFAERAEIVRGLTEWNYGDFEGLTSPEIKAKQADWNVSITAARAGKTTSKYRHAF